MDKMSRILEDLREKKSTVLESKQATSLMNKNNDIWDKLGVSSGGELKEKYWDEFKKEMRKVIKDKKIPVSVLDELTEENYHSLREVIEELMGEPYTKPIAKEKGIKPEKLTVQVGNKFNSKIGVSIEIVSVNGRKITVKRLDTGAVVKDIDITEFTKKLSKWEKV
jgi:hypothetical protein